MLPTRRSKAAGQTGLAARELNWSSALLAAAPPGWPPRNMRRRDKVHVYDRNDRIGGLLIYGIPNFKLKRT